MNISDQNAMEIVTQISGIINQNVNMMDEKGIIIASTDAKRIGTYHEGAARVVSDHLDQLIIQKDDEMEGTRKGINLPVLLNGEIVGVIGVTGEYGQVVKYVQIIKKMTEVFLLENYLNHQAKIDKRIMARFLDEWIFERSALPTPQFAERGARLGVDVTIPRRVICAEIDDLKSYSDSPEGQIMIDQINKTVRQMMEEKGNIFAKTASQMICLVSDCDDHKIRGIAAAIQERVRSVHQNDLLIGIDGRNSILHRSYLEAKKALQACSSSVDGGIRFYESVNLEIFMDEISIESKSEYIRRIFRGCDEEETLRWIGILRVYFSTNGSINETARRLYIHKNTLQYRLRKLTEQTGHDPRVLTDAALYYLAIQFFDQDQEEHSMI